MVNKFAKKNNKLFDRDQAAVTEQLNKVNKKFEEEKKQLYACHKDAENVSICKSINLWKTVDTLIFQDW